MKNPNESFDESISEKPRKPIASIEYGGPGHETEYVFSTRANRFGETQEIPTGWEQNLSGHLGKEWGVMDRGNRIEIMPPNLTRTAETDSKLMETLWLVIGDGYEFSEIK